MSTMVESSQSERLIERAKSGDREAFDVIVREHEKRLRDAIARHAEGDDLDEVVQETFVRAFESIERFEWRGGDSVFPWLFGIARNVARRLRENSSRLRPLKIPERVAGRDASPSRQIRRQERFDRLESSLAKLKPEYREVLRLARLEGLKIEEIARRMNRSQYSVKHLIARAMQQLRETLGDTESLSLPPRSLGPEGDDHGAG